MSIYQSKTTVQEWYGSSVTIPQIASPKFVPFASSCMGIAISLLDKKTNKKISVGLSGEINTAYADPDRDLIVISDKFLRGDFSAIGASGNLNAPKTVGAVLGVIVHEIGHFAYSPKDLKPYIEYVMRQTKKPFSFDLARGLANTLEDIYIEYQISRLAPTLEWTLAEINKLMLTDAKYSQTVKVMKTTTRPEQNNIAAIMNFLLFAKVVTEARRVTPYAANLFRLARSVTKLENLSDRAALCLALYDLIIPDAPKTPSAPIAPKKQQSQTPEPTEDEDNDPEPDATEPTEDEELTPNAAPEPTDADSDNDSDEDDSDADSDATEAHTDDSDNEDDPEDEDAENDQSGASVGSDNEDDPENDPEDEDDPEDEENNSSGAGDSEDEDDPEPTEDDSEDDSEDEDNDQSGDSKESELGNDVDPIAQIDTFQTRETMPIPDHRMVQTDLGYKPSLDGHIVIDNVIRPDANALEMDKRYTRLSEMARQRTNANVGYGQQMARGRNLRQIHRIITDQKVFSSKVIQETVKPMDVILVLDCSGSMGTYSPEEYVKPFNEMEDKLKSASRAILGAATGLINGKCSVQVYGHTADPYRQCKQILIYNLLRNGESPAILARRLYTLNHPNSLLGERFMFYNRDGYALYEISKKFQSRDKKRVMIVISDGAPNGDGNDYDGYKAIDHTKQIVKSIRASGVEIYSISIDQSAYHANNTIYGRDFNTNAKDANAIDALIRQLYK